MFDNFNLHVFLLSMGALVLCITIHEFAHAMSAYKAGDDTPKHQGRLSLNPVDHLDPIGTLMMVMSSLAGFGIGWGKPVQVNPANFRHPRWDDLKVSLWGPLSNILTGAAVGLILRFMAPALPANLTLFMYMFISISIGLALFNLIPIYPLDGSHIVTALLPLKQARGFAVFMGQYGGLIFLALVFLRPGLLPMLLDPPRTFLINLIMGR